MTDTNNRTLASALSIYFDKRMPRIFLLGIMQGFPWVLIGSTLSLWLKEDGFSRSAIGLFGLVFSVYSINFLWAPLLDRIRIPFLSAKFGQRRAWIFLMQLFILISMVTLFNLNSQFNLWWIALFAFIIALSSATQDISLDALRIDLIKKEEPDQMTAAAALMVAGWWTAFKLGGAIALYLAQFYQNIGIDNSWQLVYLSLTAVIIIANLLILTIKDEIDELRTATQKSYDIQYSNVLSSAGINYFWLNRALAWFMGALVSPLWSFFRNNGVAVAIMLLGFIMLFKIGEAFLGRMSIIFYEEVGFSKVEIATYSKTLGWVATVLFSIIGGLINARLGLIVGVFVSGLAMAGTNLLFAVMALIGPDTTLFAVAVIADDFTSAVSTVTFVAFISQLCDKTFSATQYALMASIATFARNTLASSSGIMVDGIEKFVITSDLSILGANTQNSAWFLFFLITTLMVLPSLGLLWLISDKLKSVFTKASTKIL